MSYFYLLIKKIKDTYRRMPRHKLKDGNKAEILVEIILMGAFRPTHGIPLDGVRGAH